MNVKIIILSTKITQTIQYLKKRPKSARSITWRLNSWIAMANSTIVKLIIGRLDA